MMQIDIYKIIYIPYFFLVFFVVVGSHDMLSTLDALLPDRSFGFRSFVFFLNDNNFEGVSFGVNSNSVLEANDHQTYDSWTV